MPRPRSTQVIRTPARRAAASRSTSRPPARFRLRWGEATLMLVKATRRRATDRPRPRENGPAALSPTARRRTPMELIDRIKKDIDARLDELRPQVEEIPRLEAVLAALDSPGGGGGQRLGRGAGAPARGARGAARPRREASSSGGPRRRARRGQRREELLQLLASNPEVTIAEAARQMGVSSPQVSTLVRRLEEEGVLQRSEGRFVVAASGTSAASAGEDAAGANGGEHDGSGGRGPTTRRPRRRRRSRAPASRASPARRASRPPSRCPSPRATMRARRPRAEAAP